MASACGRRRVASNPRASAPRPRSRHRPCVGVAADSVRLRDALPRRRVVFRLRVAPTSWRKFFDGISNREGSHATRRGASVRQSGDGSRTSHSSDAAASSAAAARTSRPAVVAARVRRRRAQGAAGLDGCAARRRRTTGALRALKAAQVHQKGATAKSREPARRFISAKLGQVLERPARDRPGQAATLCACTRTSTKVVSASATP